MGREGGMGREFRSTLRREGIGTANACPHGHFQCGDARWVAIACTSDKMFERLARAMGRPELADEDCFGQVAARLEARDEVDGLVGAWTLSMDRDAVMARCLEAQVPIGPVNSIDEIFADPQFRARGNLLTIDDPETGEVTIPGVVPRLTASPGRVDRLGPALGSSNLDVYRDLLGLDDAELAVLGEKGVI